MIKKKYAADYKVSSQKNNNGSHNKSAEYIGNYYTFTLSKELRLPLSRRLLCAGGVCCILYLIPISTVNNLSSVPYSILPHLCAAFPLWFILHSLIQTSFAKEPLIHENADKANSYLAYGAVALSTITAFAALCSCCWIFFFSSERLVFCDVLFLICDCLLLVFGITAYHFRFISKTTTVTH